MSVLITIKCESGGDAQQLARWMREKGYEVEPLTECEQDEVVIRHDRSLTVVVGELLQGVGHEVTSYAKRNDL